MSIFVKMLVFVRFSNDKPYVGLDIIDKPYVGPGYHRQAI